MTISSSAGYKSAIYAPTREVRARVTIDMSAFSQAPSQVFNDTQKFTGKIAGSTVVNPHVGKLGSNVTTLQTPSSASWGEFVQAEYNKFMTLDGTLSSNSRNTSAVIAQQLFSFDIFQLLERKFGRWIWGKRNPTISEKKAVANAIITSCVINWYGRGTCPAGNKVVLNRWSESSVSWTAVSSSSHTNGTVTQLQAGFGSATSLPFTNAIDSNGFIHVNANTDASNGTTASVVMTDYIEIVLTVTQTTLRTFDDSRIVSADIIEETDILNVTSPANQLTIKLDNTDNLFNFIGLNNIQTIIASRPKFFMEYASVLADGSEEWIPAGVFYMTDWKSDVGGMSVTFVCHDSIMILANSTFPIQPISNVGTALQSLLAGCGITDYVYDPLIDTLNLGNRPTRYTNCRTLLQNLCIGTGLTLYQDRLGTLRLSKFPPLLQSLTFTTFTTSQLVAGVQASLFGGYTSSTVVGGQPKAVSKQDTDGGMRALTLDQMFDIPQLTLEPSVYQITVNVYKNNPSDPSFDIYIYTNPAVSGQSGDSFTLDNMLITDTTTAQAVANRFFAELNYNAVYVSRWRQNPVLESTDVIMINDSLTSAKQTRVTKQEFLYSGFLTGTTESRGGI